MPTDPVTALITAEIRLAYGGRITEEQAAAIAAPLDRSRLVDANGAIDLDGLRAYTGALADMATPTPPVGGTSNPGQWIGSGQAPAPLPGGSELGRAVARERFGDQAGGGPGRQPSQPAQDATAAFGFRLGLDLPGAAVTGQAAARARFGDRAGGGPGRQPSRGAPSSESAFRLGQPIAGHPGDGLQGHGGR